LNNQALGQTYHTVVYGPSAWLANIGNSNYNAFQVTAQRRARDVTFLIAYTYSKSIDDYNGPLNPTNFALSRVLSPFDLTHNFVASYTWEMTSSYGVAEAEPCLSPPLVEQVLTKLGLKTGRRQWLPFVARKIGDLRYTLGVVWNIAAWSV
jgi:hypothetical protein